MAKWPHLCKVKKSLEHLVSITLISLWMPYSSNLALLPTSWKCRVCNTKVQCIFSTSFNAWSSKLGPYLTYSLVHEMIYLLLELKNNNVATFRSRKILFLNSVINVWIYFSCCKNDKNDPSKVQQLLFNFYVQNVHESLKDHMSELAIKNHTRKLNWMLSIYILL